MRIEKAMAVIRSMNAPRRVRYRRPSRALTYQPSPPARHWTWETASPRERANWVRSNRALGVLDWDLCDLFCLTRAGLAAIVRGKDWEPCHHALGQESPR